MLPYLTRGDLELVGQGIDCRCAGQIIHEEQRLQDLLLLRGRTPTLTLFMVHRAGAATTRTRQDPAGPRAKNVAKHANTVQYESPIGYPSRSRQELRALTNEIAPVTYSGQIVD